MLFITGWKIDEILDLTLDQFMFIGQANFSFLSSLLSVPEKNPKKGIVAKFMSGKKGRERSLTLEQAKSKLPFYEE